MSFLFLLLLLQVSIVSGERDPELGLIEKVHGLVNFTFMQYATHAYVVDECLRAIFTRGLIAASFSSLRLRCRGFSLSKEDLRCILHKKTTPAFDGNALDWMTYVHFGFWKSHLRPIIHWSLDNVSKI